MNTHTLLVAALATTSLLSAQDANTRAFGTPAPHATNGEARLYTPELAVLDSELRIALDYETMDADNGTLLLTVGSTNFSLFGVNVFVDASNLLADLPFTTRTSFGSGTDLLLSTNIPNDPSILGSFFGQVIILDTTNTGTPFGFLGSDALEITIGAQEPTQTGELVITEIMQNPSAVSDSAGEYIEIYNPGTADIDIEGWWIQDEDFDGVVLRNGGNGIVVPAGGYKVLAVNDDFASNGNIPNNPFSWGYDAFFCSNSADEVALVRPNGTIVDIVRYDGGSVFPDPNGASMSLLPAFLNAQDNDDGLNWAAATTPYGAGDLGTPGSAN